MQEFQIGDEVSFRAYKYQPKEGLGAKVVDIQQGYTGTGKHLDGSPDSRTFYLISGPRIVSNTSGSSIMGSRYYKEPTE